MPNFNVLPPEINVSNIRGPGSKPIRIAAATWASLADELRSEAEQWRNQVIETEDLFKGGAAGNFIAAAGRYYTWLYKHAYTASVTAEYLNQAASAYETTVNLMVPTASIVANRAAALTMKTTNLLGQFTTKIMELDRAYQEMWAQNAEAMNIYQFVAFDIMRLVEEAKIMPVPVVISNPFGGFDDGENIIIKSLRRL
ncbi:PPE family protein [Mycobacterium haemophilum]|uniref:PPE family protein n=1 Tax=Mycobacterium haemophilum TaxID=29311 RepID=UPI00069A4789|nr:PPE family protein [Mycobacterium haemophilum]